MQERPQKQKRNEGGSVSRTKHNVFGHSIEVLARRKHLPPPTSSTAAGLSGQSEPEIQTWQNAVHNTKHDPFPLPFRCVHKRSDGLQNAR